MFGPRSVARGAALALLCFVASCGGGGGGSQIPSQAPAPVAPTVPAVSGMQRIATDIFSNSTSQHATIVEPSIASAGTTVVTAFQSGRFASYGASDIAVATSHDGGVTWLSGALPSSTLQSSPPGIFNSVSDPVVAYDAAHATWLMSTIPVQFATDFGPAALVSRSADGVIWSAPAQLFANQDLSDKAWIACDGTRTSPYYGHCYIVWDEAGAGLRVHASTTVDGGLTWSPAVDIPGNAAGIDAQPVVQPSGKVIVSMDDPDQTHIFAFSTSDGGLTWTAPATVAQVLWHGDPAGMRSSPFVASAADSGGTIYDVWSDCRFRVRCGTNDIVLSTSRDGVAWTAPARIPVDSAASAADYLLPSIAVDPLTGGGSAHVAVGYYTFATSPCTAAQCALSAAFVTSGDGGNSWANPATLAGPMNPGSIAHTGLGAMVGDYLGTAFSGGHVIGLASVAFPLTGAYDQALYATLPSTLTFASAQRMTRSERAQSGLQPQLPRRPGP